MQEDDEQKSLGESEAAAPSGFSEPIRVLLSRPDCNDGDHRFAWEALFTVCRKKSKTFTTEDAELHGGTPQRI